MGKLLALDIGDRWVGIAITDKEKMVARPYETIELSQLRMYLPTLIEKENVEALIVGNPLTMKGKISNQTERIQAIFETIKQIVSIPCHLWDERLSSKRASHHLKNHSKQEKHREHAVAAAYILDSYLLYLSFRREDLP